MSLGFRPLLACLLLLSIVLTGCDRDAEKPATSNDTPPTSTQQPTAPSEQPAKKPSILKKIRGDDKTMHMAEKDDLRPEAAWAQETSSEYPINAYNNYVETGDLEAIKKHGKLRILVDISNTDSLHRSATQQDIELEEARRLADALGLEPVVLYTNNFAELGPNLVQGKGDIVANNVVITEARKEHVDFSIPTANTHLILVSRSDEEKVTEKTDLKGKTLFVTKGTAYVDAARKLASQHPGLELKEVEKNYVELVIDVSEKLIDFTIVEEQIYDLVTQFKDNLEKNYVFPEERQMSWAIRKDSPELLAAVNAFVRESQLTRSTKRFIGDFDDIKKRGVIRVVTRNHPGSYYMWKGRIMGYEFELAQAFAKIHKLRLEILVAPRHEDLMTMLQEGKADIAASLLSITERRKHAHMAFGPPYMEEKVVIVARENESFNDPSELAGRTVYVRKSSNHYDVALELQKKVPDLKIELAPEALNIQQIIDKVAEKEYDLAIADNVSVKLEHAWRTDIHTALDLHIEDNVYAWMLRDNNPQLLEAVNKFFNGANTKKHLKTLYTKYFAAPKRSREEINRLNEDGTISPFDEYVQKYSQEYDFDWRLVVAQMFQESTFNPKAKSWVGARGLMQVMPDTGKQVGEKNLFDPETSVRAGIKYLEWLHRKFEDKGITPENMMWFTLAAYNAGLGHVYDAQDLAEEKGWDRKVWFNNVENAMLLLSEKEYYTRARYGYARGQEPYDYVRKIQARFRTYVALLEDYERRQKDEEQSLIEQAPELFAGAFYLPQSHGSWPPSRNESNRLTANYFLEGAGW
ncbi:transporter substrate-binding domain-containing protein [Microbulbifer sp. SA54]|uniref:transporter substrate-binding domain-containing protein n=1 Tax=Microbulbifer sp. SA54 TaxID=3401577 RepID=UPI003AAE51F4